MGPALDMLGHAGALVLEDTTFETSPRGGCETSLAVRLRKGTG